MKNSFYLEIFENEYRTLKELQAQKIRDSESFVDFEVEFSRKDIKVIWSKDNRNESLDIL